VVLHALEDDLPIPGGIDALVGDVEQMADAEVPDLGFDEGLRGVRQRFLDFADADGPGAGVGDALLDKMLPEEMALARAAAAVGALVPSRL